MEGSVVQLEATRGADGILPSSPTGRWKGTSTLGDPPKHRNILRRAISLPSQHLIRLQAPVAKRLPRTT